MGEMRNIYVVLAGKTEGKRILGRPRRRWEDNIGVDLGEIVWEHVDWFHVAQDRDHWRALVNTVMNFWLPQKAGNYLTSSATVSFSRRTLLYEISYNNTYFR
jgi:hypothetical protein